MITLAFETAAAAKAFADEQLEEASRRIESGETVRIALASADWVTGVTAVGVLDSDGEEYHHVTPKDFAPWPDDFN